MNVSTQAALYERFKRESIRKAQRIGTCLGNKRALGVGSVCETLARSNPTPTWIKVILLITNYLLIYFRVKIKQGVDAFIKVCLEMKA